MCSVIGIDATNIRSGGGVTHLIELLDAADPTSHGVSKIIIWGNDGVLQRIHNRPWLKKITPNLLNKSLPWRLFWQIFHFSNAAKAEGCTVLLVPGAFYAGGFKPIVSISQNLLPFELRELRRYGISVGVIKMLLLRVTQSFCFRNSAGIIFLTEYAKKIVLNITGSINGRVAIIPHGINPIFKKNPKKQFSISNYGDLKPYKLIYVSSIDPYKHQWNVVEAVYQLRKEGFPLALDLIGPPVNANSIKKLNNAIVNFDPNKSWVKYSGFIDYEILSESYKDADLGIFASSCENMPNILLEMMAAGLPIACSRMGPMPEIMGLSGVYFDPEDPYDIAQKIKQLIISENLRTQISNIFFELTNRFSWERCANETLQFVVDISDKNVS